MFFYLLFLLDDNIIDRLKVQFPYAHCRHLYFSDGITAGGQGKESGREWIGEV
jgi:hypothetical protein